MSETNVIGEVEETTITQLNSLRQAAKDIAAEIGNIEIRKARMIGSMGEIEAKAQELLANEAKRLDIPEGTAWQVTPEGKAIILKEEANG
jgi:hypothetical protein